MLLVDERIGSKDLLTPLIRQGVPAYPAWLEFGDFAFIGKGIDGADVQIGIELKRVGRKDRTDLVSSMYSTRFAGHQLIGLQGYERAWLLTEGIWRAGEGGVLETLSRGWHPVTIGSRMIMMSDLESWILTQIIRGGVNHWHCSTPQDTARFLSVLYHWWTDKELQEHRSHQAIYLPPPDRVMLTAPSDFVKGMVAGVPGLGWEKAHALEQHFAGDGKIGRMKAATAKELQACPGIGKVLAANIQRFLE